MDAAIGADTAKLAGLQMDLLAKIRKGQITLEHLAWFNRLTKRDRDRFCDCTINMGPCIITIDRTQPFDPVKFMNGGWIIDEQDERSLALTELDLHKVRLEHMLKRGERAIKHEECFNRLKQADYVRLDAKIFQTLCENQLLIPEAWKKKTKNHKTFISFAGTILRIPSIPLLSDTRFVLYLRWDDVFLSWVFGYHQFKEDCLVSHLSAVIAA